LALHLPFVRMMLVRHIVHSTLRQHIFLICRVSATIRPKAAIQLGAASKNQHVSTGNARALQAGTTGGCEMPKNTEKQRQEHVFLWQTRKNVRKRALAKNNRRKVTNFSRQPAKGAAKFS